MILNSPEEIKTFFTSSTSLLSIAKMMTRGHHAIWCTRRWRWIQSRQTQRHLVTSPVANSLYVLWSCLVIDCWLAYPKVSLNSFAELSANYTKSEPTIHSFISLDADRKLAFTGQRCGSLGWRWNRGTEAEGCRGYGRKDRDHLFNCPQPPLDVTNQHNSSSEPVRKQRYKCKNWSEGFFITCRKN